MARSICNSIAHEPALMSREWPFHCNCDISISERCGHFATQPLRHPLAPLAPYLRAHRITPAMHTKLLRHVLLHNGVSEKKFIRRCPYTIIASTRRRTAHRRVDVSTHRPFSRTAVIIFRCIWKQSLANSIEWVMVPTKKMNKFHRKHEQVLEP